MARVTTVWLSVTHRRRDCLCHYGSAFMVLLTSKQQLCFQVTAMSNTESVVIETSVGDIQLELYWDHAPKVCISIMTTTIS